MKALGILVNLTQDGEEAESLMVDHGAALLGILVSLLQDTFREDKLDQVVCLLVNLSGCSVEKVKDILTGCDDLMRAVARILVGYIGRYSRTSLTWAEWDQKMPITYCESYTLVLLLLAGTKFSGF